MLKMVGLFISLLMLLGSTQGQNVFVSTNQIATGRTTGSTSSFVFDAQGLNATSNLAVDGNTNGNFFSGSCFSSALSDDNPLWFVDLGSNFNIYSVRIFNRGDCCAERLNNIRVDILQNNPLTVAPGTVQTCGTIGNPGGVGLSQSREIVCPFQTFYYYYYYYYYYYFYFYTVFQNGRYIRVTKTSTGDADGLLTLCEVQVNVATNVFYPYSSVGVANAGVADDAAPNVRSLPDGVTVTRLEPHGVMHLVNVPGPVVAKPNVQQEPEPQQPEAASE